MGGAPRGTTDTIRRSGYDEDTSRMQTMIPAAIIAKTRDGRELTEAEIRFMIEGMLTGEVADYQMAAWAMAILWRGMTPPETAILTRAMLDSGNRLPRVSDRPRVDKHSTGGLGDKVSLILAPLLACCDLEVPMLSGRGLGITGGTLDKLESYPGMRCDLTIEEINRCLLEVGCVITGTTDDIAPADRRLYALRDVTGTVPSITLITASILSKKLAETLDALVLDVKFGSGALMKELEQARQLASSLQATAAQLHLSTAVTMSSMRQPLGRMVGNACEVNEAVEVLRGGGPQEVRRLVLHLAGQALTMVDPAIDPHEAHRRLAELLDSGQALTRFAKMIELQGGKFTERLAVARPTVVESPHQGWVSAIDGEAVGNAIIELGGGRRRMEDRIDHRVGIELSCRIGDRVEHRQELVRVFCDDANLAARVGNRLLEAIQLSDQPQAADELIVT
ncbi:MAG: thymidine phosphorylase [Pirellulaceae bacterium]|nr:MAG: thymidine phosphorylase [Pirellulaceae bacterium]